jgi:hypothetical protein
MTSDGEMGERHCVQVVVAPIVDVELGQLLVVLGQEPRQEGVVGTTIAGEALHPVDRGLAIGVMPMLHVCPPRPAPTPLSALVTTLVAISRRPAAVAASTGRY